MLPLLKRGLGYLFGALPAVAGILIAARVYALALTVGLTVWIGGFVLVVYPIMLVLLREFSDKFRVQATWEKDFLNDPTIRMGYVGFGGLAFFFSVIVCEALAKWWHGRDKTMSRKMHLPSAARLFTDTDGRSIIALDTEPAAEGGVLFSPNGIKFFELLVTDHNRKFIGNGLERGKDRVGFETRLQLRNPHHNTTSSVYWFWFLDEHLELNEFDLDGIRLTRGECPKEVEVVPLPAQLTVTFNKKDAPALFQTTTGQCVLYPKWWSPICMFSADGKQFFQTRCELGYTGGSDAHFFEFSSPNQGIRMNVWKDRTTMILGGEQIGETRWISDHFPQHDDRHKPFIKAFGGKFVLNETSLKKFGLTARDVIENKGGKIRVIDVFAPRLILGGDQLTGKPCPSSVEVVRAPKLRVPLHLFRQGDGSLLYASFDPYGTIARHRHSCQTIKMFAGSADELQELQINAATSYSDGMIVIETTVGKFTTLDGPTWNDAKLTWLDPALFDIVETDGKVWLKET